MQTGAKTVNPVPAKCSGRVHAPDISDIPEATTAAPRLKLGPAQATRGDPGGVQRAIAQSIELFNEMALLESKIDQRIRLSKVGPKENGMVSIHLVET